MVVEEEVLLKVVVQAVPVVSHFLIMLLLLIHHILSELVVEVEVLPDPLVLLWMENILSGQLALTTV